MCYQKINKNEFLVETVMGTKKTELPHFYFTAVLSMKENESIR